MLGQKVRLCYLFLAGSLVTDSIAANPAYPEIKSEYVYDGLGRLSQIDGPRPISDAEDIIKYEYNPAGLVSAIFFGPELDGRSKEFYDHDDYGNPRKIINVNQSVSRLVYNLLGMPTSSSIHPDEISLSGPAATFTYDAEGNLTCVTDAAGVKTVYEYSMIGELTGIIENANSCDPALITQGSLMRLTLDQTGQVTQEQIFDGPSTSAALLFSRSFGRDELGRMISTQGSNGQVTDLEYDANGFVTAVKRKLNELNDWSEESFVADELGRMHSMLDAGNGQILLGYLDGAKVNSVTDQRGNATVYGYDDFARKTSTDSPEAGFEQLLLDEAGNPKSYSNGLTVEQTLEYDAINRLVTATYPSSSQDNIAYHYDDYAMDALNSDPSEASSYSTGELTGIDSGSISSRFYYDFLGNISKEKTTVSGTVYEVAYSRNSIGQLTGITYPSGLSVLLAYDSNGDLSDLDVEYAGWGNVSTGTNSVPVVTAVDYMPFGPLKAFTMANGIRVVRGYNQDYQLASENVLNGGTVETSQTLVYDLSGNLTDVVEPVGGNGDSFDYDALNRLTAAAISGAQNFQYQYDSAGNRIFSQFPAGNYTNEISLNYDSTSSQLTSIQLFGFTSDPVSYDDNGNISSYTKRQYTPEGTLQERTITLVYDQMERVSQSTVQLSETLLAGGVTNASYSSTYLYNGLNQRIQKSTTDHLGDSTVTHYSYDAGGHLIYSEVRENNVLSKVTHWIYLDGAPVLQVDEVLDGATGQMMSPKFTYLLTDQVGAVKSAYNDSGAKLFDTIRGPFGEIFEATDGTISVDLRFAGQVNDEETGLFYNHFRYYDPSLGRYLQSDPIGVLRDYSNPQLQLAIAAGMPESGAMGASLNHLYGYAFNNPLRYVDPNGLFPAPWCSRWDIILGLCPDIPKDIPYDKAVDKWWEQKKGEYCSKPCSAVESACKRAMGPGCYMAGTPCLAPCEMLKQECMKKKEGACGCDN